MNNQFVELAKALAQSVTRRVALKKFGVGFPGIALAAIGLAPSALAGSKGAGEICTNNGQCQNGLWCTRGICTTSGGPGTVCSSQADCAAGLVCAGYPGGLRPVCQAVRHGRVKGGIPI